MDRDMMGHILKPQGDSQPQLRVGMVVLSTQRTNTYPNPP